jgi:hypothetical protein
MRYVLLKTENQCSCDRLDQCLRESSTIKFRDPLVNDLSSAANGGINLEGAKTFKLKLVK